MKKFKIVLLVIMIFPFWGGIIDAFDIPEQDGFITDLGNVLTEEEEIQLEQKIQDIENNLTAQIAVLTIPSTNGIEISSYAKEVGQTWGVGLEGRDNGIVIVVAVNDRKVFIVVGYGVEGLLPDKRIQQIAEQNFPLNFSLGNYFAGIDSALSNIDEYLQQDVSIISVHKNNITTGTPSLLKKYYIEGLSIFMFLLILGITMFFIKRKERIERKNILS